uniref:Tensin 3 n=1 Tax=Gadus morhua TaxID=8049 RepID=A0A8C4ZFV8_GADMO
MEEGYELDLTYITERIIAVSFPRACSEEIYAHNLKDVTRMLRSKHADNYLTINLSERRADLSRINSKTLDTGWPDLHAPPLDKICTICKAMEGWLNTDPLHVVVIHCRGGKGRIGVVISSFIHFTDISASADQALDRFAMRKYYDDKVSALMTPSQKRYVWILNSLLSGSMKINASPLFLHCIILHGLPNFDASGVCRPYLKVYQGMQAVYSSGVYHIGPGHRDRLCIPLEPAQLLKGDIMIKCYHKSDVTSEREVVFRLQFHTGAVQGYSLSFDKEDMEAANKDPRFPDYGRVELVFTEGPERIPDADRWHNGADVMVDYNTADPILRWDSYQDICDGEVPRSQGLGQDRAAPKKSPVAAGATLGRGARTTSAASSPDHSDHALSASSDSGLSSTSLWTDRPAPPGQGPSRHEKAELNRLLSGFGLEEPSLEEMDDRGDRPPAHQAHVNGDPGPGERETDILDDEVMMTGHDLHSVDSLGTNSLLFTTLGRSSGTTTRLGGASWQTVANSVGVGGPQCSGAWRRRRVAQQQQLFRQGSYSTHSWVRQQQMVAAQQFGYVLACKPGSSPPSRWRNPVFRQGRDGPEPQEDPDDDDDELDGDDGNGAGIEDCRPATSNNNNNCSRDEEFKSLTVDIDNSIDQLNQLIMDLDPTFMPVSSRSGSVKRNGGVGNASDAKYSNGNGTDQRLHSKSVTSLHHTQQTGKRCGRAAGGNGGGHAMLYRSDSVDYRAQGPDMDSGIEAGSDIAPPTPSFPISPPTPYGECVTVAMDRPTMSVDYAQHSPPSPSPHPGPNAHSSPQSAQRSRLACYALSRGPASHLFDGEQDVPTRTGYGGGGGGGTNGCLDRNLLTSLDGSGGGGHSGLAHTLLQPPPPLLPEKKRASDGELSLGTASPVPSGFSSPHSGSSLSIPFPNSLPDLSLQTQGVASPLPDVLSSRLVTVKFVQDTSKFWYKDQEAGCFIVRDSHSFKGAYGLAMKVATPPPSVLQQSRRAGGDLSNELVRHFLIECTQKGVRLKGCPNEPYFGSLTALVCQHSITPLALPCKLIIPDRDPLEDVVESTSNSVTNSAAELLKQGAACNVWFLGSVEMESLTGIQAVQKATTRTLASDPLPTSTVVHFKVSSQGITLTDNQRRLFFRRHYPVNMVIYCALDPQDRKIFGFVARKTGNSMDNVCHLFAEHDPEQPASAIVNFVSKVMIGSQKSK